MSLLSEPADTIVSRRSVRQSIEKTIETTEMQRLQPSIGHAPHNFG